MGEATLGPCCSCGKEGGDVRNVLMLNLKAPVQGTGWGCAVCGLPPDGAVAVLCDSCFSDGVEIVDVCYGYPADGVRIPITELSSEPFDHNAEYHQEPDTPQPENVKSNGHQ